jgi:beta-mannosidase
MNEQISLNGVDWLFKGYLGEDWLWRNAHKPGSRDAHGWTPGSVPGSVQHDLWQYDEIPDPYFERNSLLIEWVPERTWLYKKSFTIGESYRGRRIRLCFEGVDYEARVYLNGDLLGQHRGMYTPARFEVSERLLYGQENLLVVVIDPAPQEQPQVGRTSRVHTHKARMNYWWDFCPRMVHIGIWDDVYLEVSGQVRIEDAFVRPRLVEDLSRADIFISMELSTEGRTDVQVETVLRYKEQIVASRRSRHTLSAGINSLTASLEVDWPHLWWPNGHGPQTFYLVDVLVAEETVDMEGSLLSAPDLVSDWRQVPVGIRRVEFVANEGADEPARPYTLVVNGRRMFIKGWNWVPMDALYGVPRPEKLARLLNLARKAHVNLLRVWGGGLIEKESFYTLCDRYGILVWQEFIQSSSGIDNRPPESAAHVEMLFEEARQIIPRKRNHPSLAVWCGGNELMSGPEQPLDESHPLLAMLRDTVQVLDPLRYWLPTSPSGPYFAYSLEKSQEAPQDLHDVHGPWEHQGLEKHQALYNGATSLLHSEFGVEGITNQSTLDSVIAREHQWPVSLENPYWFHLGAWWVKAARWREVFGEVGDIQTLVRATQFLQADGLRYAVEADRRRQFHNSGTLPWQFNEPYPMAACTSSVDYFARPKPAYYAIARAYAPLSVTARFPTQAWEGRGEFEAELWVSFSGDEEIPQAVLEARLVGASGQCYAALQKEGTVLANAAALFAPVRWDLANVQEQVFFLDLRLLQPGGSSLAENRYIFSRTVNLAPILAVPGTTLETVLETTLEPAQAGESPAGPDRWVVRVTNRESQAALFVWLQDGEDPAGKMADSTGRRGYTYFSDNHFCLLSGESRLVTVEWENVTPEARRVSVSGWNTNEEGIRIQ